MSEQALQSSGARDAWSSIARRRNSPCAIPTGLEGTIPPCAVSTTMSINACPTPPDSPLAVPGAVLKGDVAFPLPPPVMTLLAALMSRSEGWWTSRFETDEVEKKAVAGAAPVASREVDAMAALEAAEAECDGAGGTVRHSVQAMLDNDLLDPLKNAMVGVM